ncbi:ABC transporter substrate-binding protein [Croceibacterium soli]|uniref:ABC transporter substrate-binding protein n=1 Tax=Croceibacterium soli TaxID=1739690 RepID=UPI002E273DD4
MDVEPVGPAHHPTIVSLNPCTDAILAEVTAPGQLLAISHYSHDPRASSMPPAQARRYAATGGTVEEVLALDPDVVVAGTFLDPATAQAFRRLGIRVETVGIAATVAGSTAQVRRLAGVSGNRSGGEALVARIERSVAATERDGPRPEVLVWQEGGLVPGPDTLVAELLANSGFASHSAARGLGQGAYVPLERVLADPPQIVLVAGGDRMLHHPVLQDLPGVRYEKLEPSLLFCGGPTIPRLAGRLAALRDQALRAPPPTPSSEEEGASAQRNPLPLLFRGGGRGVVETTQ